MKFEKALQVSINNLQSFGRLYFTPKQLYYEFCRQTRSPIGLEKKTAAALFGLSAIPVMFLRKNKLGLLTASAFIFGSLAVFRQIPQTLKPPVSQEEFEQFLHLYQQNNEIKGLLEIEPKINFAEDFPTDLTLFGLPKVLICESDEIAQMLRTNQFHLQTPCAVLSLSEASPLPETFQKMLNRAESPRVYFLHDASLAAFSILQNLRQTLRLKEEIPLRPLGLRPVHAKRLHLFTARKVSQKFDLAEFVFLPEEEKKWLANGNLAEVSAVSPVRLMRVLRRIILETEIPPSDWQIILPKKELGFM